jgi:Transglycosylase SLT domain
MRAMLALAILLLGLSSAAPEPEYASLLADFFHVAGRRAHPPLVEIESALGRSNRLAVVDLREDIFPDPLPDLGTAEPLLAFASEGVDSAEVPVSADIPVRAPEISMGDLCHALLTSAKDNGLPVPFFANLIWQESRLRDDAVSPVGAQGIAQFMPRVAVATGLENPFDPLQAIPASARLLRELHAQFRNLGFVAAAYNAGARRVSDWLERRRGLPRETRGYVMQVTGSSVEQWRTSPPNDRALTFVHHLPCRDLPAFAGLEQAQLAAHRSQQIEAAAHRPIAEHALRRMHVQHEAAAGRNRHGGKRQAEHTQHAMRERRGSA